MTQGKTNRKTSPQNLLVVIGGSGGAGSSTIAKLLAKQWKLQRIYAGKVLRKMAIEMGYANHHQNGNQPRDISEEDFARFQKEIVNTNPDIDYQIEQKMFDFAQQSNVLIESKVFAGVTSKIDMPCSVKIWLTAPLDICAERIVEREKAKNIDEDLNSVKENLKKRMELHQKRWVELYSVDISKPEGYNDIVLDTGNLTIKQTFDEILSRIRNDARLKQNFADQHFIVSNKLIAEMTQQTKSPSTDPAGSKGQPKSPSDSTSKQATSDQAAQKVQKGETEAQDVVSHEKEAMRRRWKCESCGFVYEGYEVLEACPRCGESDPMKFRDVD